MRLSRQEKQLLVNLLEENKKKLSHNSLSQMGGQPQNMRGCSHATIIIPSLHLPI